MEAVKAGVEHDDGDGPESMEGQLLPGAVWGGRT